MQRLVNMTKAPVEGGHPLKPVPVAPGEAGDFDVTNPSVKILLKAGHLRTESEIIAARAASLADTPTKAQLVILQEELAKAKAQIAEFRTRETTRAAEWKRLEGRMSELVAMVSKGEEAEKRVNELEAWATEHANAVTERDAIIEELRAQLPAEPADAPTTDAPAEPSAEQPATDAAATPAAMVASISGRSRRRG